MSFLFHENTQAWWLKTTSIYYFPLFCELSSGWFFWSGLVSLGPDGLGWSELGFLGWLSPVSAWVLILQGHQAYARGGISVPSGERASSNEQALFKSLLVCWCLIGQNKTHGRPRFKEWRKRLSLFRVRAARGCECREEKNYCGVFLCIQSTAVGKPICLCTTPH